MFKHQNQTIEGAPNEANEAILRGGFREEAGKMQQVVETIQTNAKEQLRVELTEFKGHDLLGMRVYAETNSGYIATEKSRLM